MPNLFILYILFIGLFIGKKLGAIFGLFFGIYLDILIGQAIGVTGVMLAIIGLLAEYFDKNFSKESRVTIMLMVIGTTILYEVGVYGFDVVKYYFPFEIQEFAIILTIEVLFNTLLTIILYPIFQKLGYKVEEVFKAKRVLTRYF